MLIYDIKKIKVEVKECSWESNQSKWWNWIISPIIKKSNETCY